MVTNSKKELSHNELYDKIQEVETHLDTHNKGVTRLLYFMVPFAIASCIWIWSSHTTQASINSSVEQKLVHAKEDRDSASRSRQRIESRLDEILQYVREDIKEIRDKQHSHGAKE